MTENARISWLLAAVLVVLGGLIVWRLLPVLEQRAEGGRPALELAVPGGGGAPAGTPPAGTSGGRPSFDVVRISPEGMAVLAGKAAPGAQVEVRANGKLIGSATAGAHDGSWVMVLETPLAAGSTELTLAAKLPDGTSIEAQSVLLVDVPKRGEGGEALAVLAPRPGSDGVPTVLQGPGDTAALSVEDGPVLESVDYDSTGAVRLSGRGKPGTTIRLYLDDKPLGDIAVGASGHWQFSPRQDLAAGRYRLRLDEVAPDGRVATRREMPFERAERGAVTIAAESRFVVQPGNSLWRIAERSFGTGFRYVDIYRANKAKIVDPDLIYPGQVFDLPE